MIHMYVHVLYTCMSLYCTCVCLEATPPEPDSNGVTTNGGMGSPQSSLKMKKLIAARKKKMGGVTK